ncbi:MAG TPA: peptide deformylase [bacterium]|jgi:peptide deformylase
MGKEPKVLEIIKYGHPTLRVKCERVTEFNEELRELADSMFLTMAENEGVGLAASQVNRRIQMLVVGVPIKDSDEMLHLAIVNPEIVEGRSSWDYEEGCLSIPDIRENVTRPEIIKLNYQDLEGKPHTLETGGMLARVLQHEIDHLNGILFVDRLSPIRRALLKNRLKDLARETSKALS